MEYSKNEVEKCLARYYGTPHRDRMNRPQLGVDCINLVVEVLISGGVCERFKIPTYDTRAGWLRDSNTIADRMLEAFHCDAIAGDDLQDLDVIIFKVGRTTNHVGLFYQNQVWHVQFRDTVRPEKWEVIEPFVETVIRINRNGLKNAPPSRILKP